MQNTSKAPVALFVYNRLSHTQRTISALEKNFGASDTDLIVFSDGAKTPQDSNSVEKVREFLLNIKGFKSVRIIQQKSNQGLANSIVAGVTQVIEEYSKVIVMEDDLITSPYFLNYMNDGLEKYKDQNRVISIHGYVYPTNDKLPETFFIRGADCWGWATWKRGWELFEADGRKLLHELQSRSLTKEFNYNGAHDYLGMLENQIAGKISSWAIRWHASAFLENKLTLYPGQSLVQNIGIDGSGTHCEQSSEFDVSLKKTPVHFNEIPIEESNRARDSFEQYFNKNKPKPFAKLKKHFLSIMKF